MSQEMLRQKKAVEMLRGVASGTPTQSSQASVTEAVVQNNMKMSWRDGAHARTRAVTLSIKRGFIDG
jgi:hypothetical protein